LPLPGFSLGGKIAIMGHAAASFGMDVADLLASVIRHVRFRPKGYSLNRALNSAWQNSAIRLDCAVAGTLLKSRLGMAVPEESRVRPAEIAKTIKSLPAIHRSYCMKLYDAACAWRPRQLTARSVLVFEATKEPDRSISSVGRKWASIARNVKTVTIKGSHMSIVRPPDGLPLASALCQALREASQDIR
jgi:thioesterase domain-containing protein